MLHCYSSVCLTLLVAVLLSGTSQLVSCSYDKTGHQDSQTISRTEHEKQLLAATSDADDRWRVCGKLSLSSKYKIHAAVGLQNILLHHSESVDVAISPGTGIMRCRCRLHHPVPPPSVDITNHQVAIRVQVVDREEDNHFKIRFPMELNPCLVSFCQKNPSSLLMIKQLQSSSRHITLQLNSECTSMLLEEHSSSLNVQLLGNGAVALSALPTANSRRKDLSLPWVHAVGQTSDNSGILLQNQHKLNQACSIDVTRSIKLTNGIDFLYTPGINFTQLLPLELTNCISLLNDGQATVMHNVVLLSIRPWLSDHDTLHAGHNSQSSYHAELSTTADVIHEKGGQTVSKSTARQHRASNIREIRQSSTSPPEFNDTFYMGSVLENSPSGTVVIAVRATGNGQIVYSMTPDNGFSSGLFTMNRTTGVVTTTGNLDRELQSTHTFRIQAREEASGRSSIAPMTITVLDENDNTPTFEDSYFNLTVEEDEERAYVIRRFTVTDPDAGLNGMIDYTLINNTDNTFSVTEAGSQVALSLNQRVDFETKQFYLLTITARDRGSTPRSSSATFEIHVLDVADSIPQFNATSYSIEVAESAQPPTYLLTVHATSQDSAPLATLHYIEVSGDSNNQFSVDGNTGVITLTKSLDFETLQFHVLVVQAESVANPSLQSRTNVHITVINVNDHSPVFTRPLYSISVLETVSPPHLVITVDAPDSDEGIFGQVSYKFDASTEQAVNDTFMLDPVSGQVTTVRSLDREQREQYSFIVVATDGGNPPRSSTSRVSITVSDVNDEPPIFSQQQYVANISENLDAGRSVIQVLTSDRDSSASMVNYYIQSGNINSAFTINSQDGLITTRIRLDREAQASYNLLVVATDGNNENTTRVLINVLDVNDETPSFESSYNPPPVAEDLNVGSEILRVQAMDRDEGSNGEVRYTSTNIDQKFSLNRTTGAILLSLSLDYEDTTRYVFDVTATDGGRPSRSGTARVTITILDVNDNSPVFESHPSTFSIPENQPAGRVITTLTATDADSGSNAIVQYEIIGDSQAIRAFSIGQNGVIETTESLDREIISQYELVIQASDSGAVRRTETARLTVNIQDLIDYPPIFSQVVYEVLITSLHSQGLPVVTVQASTRDMVPPQSIIYRIISGANDTLFRMNQETGMIFAETNIDPVRHEGVYRLGVEAQHQSLSKSVFVIIQVMRDDGIPRLRPLTLYFSAYPTLIGPMNHLGVVEIDQPKEGQEYTFSLLYSDPRVQRHFLINPTTGVLSVAHSVLSGYYQLNISANTSTGVGFGVVEVFVSILTNQTLENAVVATFGGAREASFASIQLDQFIQFLMETIPCSRSQVEVISIQRSGLERDEMVSLAFAILEPSLTSYIARDRIVDALLANRHNAQPSTLLSFISDECSEEPCQNFQQCHPIIDIHRDNHATPFRIISGTYHFHAFRESHICTCPEGYSREDLCSSEINECNSLPCYFGAKCTDYVGGYQCECPIGTYGKNCSSICTSRESCDPCDPNPCLYEGTCNRPLHNLATYSCDACPWGNGYNGLNCELTTLHFTSDRSSFVAFPTSTDTARLDLSLRFATISPNGLLFYSGNLGNKDDYIAAELVIGQLRVSVSFGGVATMLTTDSTWNLNDGQWRSVSIKLRNRILMVDVSDCTEQSQFLRGAIETCQLEVTLPSGSGRTLELNSLLYFGGLEPHITHDNVFSTNYDGCIADVKLGGRLLDFGQPEREQGTSIGCPPIEGSCSRICQRNHECVKLWGGSVCNCDGDSCVDGRSAQLSNGYIHLESQASTINLMFFQISFRTRSSDATLVKLGDFDSLELKHGSVVYRRSYSTTNMYTPLTLEALGAVSDGVWHKISLDVNSTHTKLSVDEGRSSASSPEGGVMMITMVTLGAESSESNSSRFTGCLAGVVINSESIDLQSAVDTNTLSEYQVSTHMATSGCGQGTPCTGVQCPINTQCEAGWQNYSCICSPPNQIINNDCIDPCSTNPCKNGGTCETSHFASAGYLCTCAQGYQPPNCESVVGGRCGLGFFNPPTCSDRCLCDPQGADPRQICDSDNGDCICKVELDVYSASGDLGCRPCDCDAVGSMSSKCHEATGQCFCRENVVGRRCDRCAENFAGMDELGCKAATVVYGSFSFLSLLYKRELDNADSSSFKELSQLLSIEIERELYSFSLPGRFEARIEDFSNSSEYVKIRYKIANYLPRGSTYLSLPPYSVLAGVVQSMVQSGWVGPFQTNSSSHMVPTDCTQVPELCSGCLNATTSDGLICRAAGTCLGEDTDRDGIPNSCDSCPYNFNPNQSHIFCEPIRGVCPGGVASNILWSQTSVGTVDIKPCAAPMLGFASRTCLASQEWSEVDVLGCLSVTGQEYLAQAESLDNGKSLSFSQLKLTAAMLEEFTNEQGQATKLFGGDVQVAGRVLNGLLTQLQGHATSEAADRPERDEIVTLYEDLISMSNNLLSPNPSRGWMSVVKEAEFGAEAFLRTLEQFSVTALDIMWENSLDSSPWEYFLINTRQPSAMNRNETKIATTLLLSELSASLELPLATPTSSVAMAMFANLGHGLNSYLFNSSSTEPLSVGTPILSIQMFNEAASKVTALSAPINLTLPYRGKLFLPGLRSKAVCAWWQSGERSGWSTEGCRRVSITESHVTCQCTHLTAFAAILPAAAFQEIIIPPEGFTPHPFTYLVFAIISLLLLATLLLLAIPRHLQSLLNTTHKNLVLALLLASVVFIVGIDRTEVPEVCGAFSIGLFYLLLSCLSWMVASGIIVARFLLKTPPKEKFAITLYIVGWALPALLSGIAIGIVALIRPSESFISKFGYPYYCWISPQNFTGFVVPALLLILVYVAIVLFSIALRVRLRRKNEGRRPLTPAASLIRKNTSVVLLKSSSIFLLFLVSWGLGLVAIYLHEESYGEYLQHPFAIFYAAFGVLLFIVLCVNKNLKEAWKLQFKKQPDVIIGQTSGPVYAEIRKPPTNIRRSSRQQQQQQQPQHGHHLHHHNHHHRHGFHNPNHHHRSSTAQPEQPHRERVELMIIAQPPPHPPPSPRAMNSGNLVTQSHSSPLLNSVNVTRERQQNQNRSTSERHISENQIQSFILHVPETRTLSPLTYGSDSGSNLSNFDDIDHPPSLKSTQGVKEEIAGAIAATVVSTIAEESVGAKEDLSENPKNGVSHVLEREARLMSPTLTEIYERARKSSRGTSAGSGQDSTLGAATGGTHPNPLIPEERNGLTVASEDPLWYQNRESSHIETDPMPYETVIRSPPPLSPIAVSPTMAESERERKPSPWFSMTSVTTSPHHSDASATSSSKHSGNNSRSSAHRRSPASASPAGLRSPIQAQQRKHSFPVESARKRSGSSTKNPLYSTSDAVSAKKCSLKKHHRSFNSPRDSEPLPPLPPGVPIHSSPLPPLPHPLESSAPVRKQTVVRTGSDTTRHAKFSPHISSSSHQTDGQASPSLRMAAALSSRTPPLAQVSPPPPLRPQPYQISGTKGASVLSPSLQPQGAGVGDVEEKRSLSCSSSPARSRQKKKRGLERNDSYHSEGPSAEGKKVNQVIRHSDGSETVQSLV